MGFIQIWRSESMNEHTNTHPNLKYSMQKWMNKALTLGTIQFNSIQFSLVKLRLVFIIHAFVICYFRQFLVTRKCQAKSLTFNLANVLFHYYTWSHPCWRCRERKRHIVTSSVTVSLVFRHVPSVETIHEVCQKY